MNDQPTNSQSLFHEALMPKAPEVKDEWVDGRYKFFRVKDVVGEKESDETSLSKKLAELRSQGVRPLDFVRQHGDWVIKTMAPRDAAT